MTSLAPSIRSSAAMFASSAAGVGRLSLLTSTPRTIPRQCPQCHGLIPTFRSVRHAQPPKRTVTTNSRLFQTPTPYRPHTLPSSSAQPQAQNAAPPHDAAPTTSDQTSSTDKASLDSNTDTPSLQHSPKTLSTATTNAAQAYKASLGPPPTPSVSANSTNANIKPKSARPSSKLRPLRAALTLTPAAVTQLQALLSSPDPKFIRIGVRNRGCSGLAYNLEYVSERGTFDEEVKQDGVKVLVDSRALMSIIGSEMDWVDGKLERRFVFRNPNISEYFHFVASFCGEDKDYARESWRLKNR